MSLPTRKHPAHMPPVERHNTPILLFVTLAIQPRGPHLANPSFHKAFGSACADADAWSVGFYLIMPDHVHLFCRPARVPAVPIKRWSTYLKERITKHLHANMEGEALLSPFPWKWLPDCWDTQVRSGEHYHQKWDYILQNPVRQGLVTVPSDWPWQGILNDLRW